MCRYLRDSPARCLRHEDTGKQILLLFARFSPLVAVSSFVNMYENATFGLHSLPDPCKNCGLLASWRSSIFVYVYVSVYVYKYYMYM